MFCCVKSVAWDGQLNERNGLYSVRWLTTWKEIQVSRSSVTQWNSCFSTTTTFASHCRSRKRFYFSWNLSHNGSSKKFHKTDYVTWCNACWKLIRSAVAPKFQLKVSTCNGGFRSISHIFSSFHCQIAEKVTKSFQSLQGFWRRSKMVIIMFTLIFFPISDSRNTCSNALFQ